MFDSVKPIPVYEVEVARKRRARGPAYPVDDAWRKRVEAALEANAKAGEIPGAEISGPRNRAELARLSGVSRSTITELLNGSTNECVGLPDIHDALGWLPPYATLSDVEEILERAMRSLDEVGHGRLIERATTLVQEQNAKTRSASLPSKKPPRGTRVGVTLGGLETALREADETPAEAAMRLKKRAAV